MFRVTTDFLNLPKEYREDIEILLDLIIPNKEVIKVVLFGSCYREVIEKESDIDSAIVTEGLNPIEMTNLKINIGKKEVELNKTNNYYYDLYIVKKDTYEKAEGGVFYSTRNKKRKVYCYIKREEIK